MTPRKSFLLLVIGLDILAWVFPFRWIAAIFGFVTIWAVMGFRWGIAVALFASIPDWIQSLFYVYQVAVPIMPKINHAFDVCHSIVNMTSQNVCYNHMLNFSQFAPKGVLSSVSNAPSASWLTHIPGWLILLIISPFECFLIYRTVVKPILKIKKRIRQSVGHLYGFRRASNDN